MSLIMFADPPGIATVWPVWAATVRALSIAAAKLAVFLMKLRRVPAET
jgi:hypothetical protein